MSHFSKEEKEKFEQLYIKTRELLKTITEKLTLRSRQQQLAESAAAAVSTHADFSTSPSYSMYGSAAMVAPQFQDRNIPSSYSMYGSAGMIVPQFQASAKESNEKRDIPAAAVSVPAPTPVAAVSGSAAMVVPQFQASAKESNEKRDIPAAAVAVPAPTPVAAVSGLAAMVVPQFQGNAKKRRAQKRAEKFAAASAPRPGTSS